MDMHGSTPIGYLFCGLELIVWRAKDFPRSGLTSAKCMFSAAIKIHTGKVVLKYTSGVAAM